MNNKRKALFSLPTLTCREAADNQTSNTTSLVKCDNGIFLNN